MAGTREGGLLGLREREIADRLSSHFTSRAGYAVALCSPHLAEDTASLLYVLCEPTAYFVIAIDAVTGQTSISSSHWDSMEAEYNRIRSRSEDLVKQGKVIDAVCFAIEQGYICAEEESRQWPP